MRNYLWYGNRQMLCFLLQVPKPPPLTLLTAAEDVQHYEESRTCVEDLALYLKPLSNTRGPCHLHHPFYSFIHKLAAYAF